MRIKAVLFDFDGVLTTDATGSLSICNYIAAKTGLDLDTLKNAYKKYNHDLLYGKTTHSEIWPDLCSELNREIDIRLLYDSFVNTPIDNEMIVLVKTLKARNYKVGMITDNKTDRITRIIEGFGWEKLFDSLSISAQVGSGKENEEIFTRTLEQLGLDAGACAFIDNNEKNLVVPEKLGMKTIHFDHQRRDVALLRENLKALGIDI